MSVVINSGDNDYIGVLKATTATVNGVFVTPSYLNSTATPAADATAGDAAGLLLVCNVNQNIDEQKIDDASLSTASGAYLRLKALEVGDIFTTDQLIGTYTGFALGDKFAVGAAGAVAAIAGRTPKLSFAVLDKITLFGNNALKLVVISV
jgi:hypothetical protein